MGNQLMGIAPSQIFPVEHYLTDHNELKFDVSLGSTRFLKVARAESQEGLVVVKVFAIPDPSFPLSVYKDQIDTIRIKLSTAQNCLPFQKTVVTEKACLIMREYVKSSLYDRISTRPFVTDIEKRWITFQILYALYQCHKVGVCHGDIKLENITITSWNWVLLVDFASFKPTFLPEDNPADYSYFFDTSRRRTCYIAPERFTKSLASDSSSMFNETPCNSGDLKPAMDIFSTGCALLEFWNEGHPPFDLSQLLAYCSGEYSPQKHLDRLEDPALKNLLASMIQKDPTNRLSAETYLSQERGRLFPEYFYIFLQSYMHIFSTTPVLSPDEKIARLKNDIHHIFDLHSTENKKDVDNEDKSDEITKSSSESIDDDGLVIIVTLVTSSIRGLHDSTSKLQSLEILYELARKANEETILDRILPYIMYLIQDTNARVKVTAINTITKCLALVKRVPKSDANIFPEYILPGLAPLATDPSFGVRAAYARNIADLAETALRYLEYTQNDTSDDETPNHGTSSSSRLNYEVELHALHDMVQQTVSSLLVSSESIVKRTLMDSGITKLCVFFGKQKANDVILSHIITFLNDKEDRELRGTFFECIIGVATYLGSHCSPMLTPLLLQGLNDTCEFVTTKAINAMAALTELGLISKPALRELLTECAVFLVHPNLWIRHAVVGLICAASKWLSALDVQCKVVPIVSPYMKYPLIQIEKPELLFESLVQPIPRRVYDDVIKCNNLTALLKTLEYRQKTRNLRNINTIMRTDSSTLEMVTTTSMKTLMGRLEANGMTSEVEEHLLDMSSHLNKLGKHLTSTKETEPKDEGVIVLSTQNSNVRNFVFNLEEARAKKEYHNKLAMDLNRRQSESTNSGGPPSRATSSRPCSPSHSSDSGSHTASLGFPPNVSVHERSYIQYNISNCSADLKTLIARKQNHFEEVHRSKEWEEQAACRPQIPPPGWHLRGTLVAHLHEHRGPVTRLAPIPDSSLFASASNDGYIRLWDCSKIEGKNIANRSIANYRLSENCPIIGLTVCDNGQSLASCSQNGFINLLRIDSASKKFGTLQSRKLDPDEDGCAVELQYLDRQNMLVYATLYGSLVGWDFRAPGCAWRLENGLKNGSITTFCLDSHQNWLTLGTNSGNHIAWDLRFQFPLATIKHPTETRIRKVVNHPTNPSWIMSSVNGTNEISMWNLETGNREKVLWASTQPPLSKPQSTGHSVCAMQAGCIDRSGFLLTGGTDQRLRFWDLEQPSKSYVAICAPTDTALSCSISYQSRPIDGTDVIYEVIEQGAPSNSSKSDEVPRAGPEAPPAGHRDWITDIALCKTSQCFLLTAARDGVIKVWK